MITFKSFYSAQSTLAGIELVVMLRKGQMKKDLVGASIFWCSSISFDI